MKVHVWAGISKQRFAYLMDADLYIDILSEHLLPFVEESFKMDTGSYKTMTLNILARRPRRFIWTRE